MVTAHNETFCFYVQHCALRFTSIQRVSGLLRANSMDKILNDRELNVMIQVLMKCRCRHGPGRERYQFFLLGK